MFMFLILQYGVGLFVVTDRLLHVHSMLICSVAHTRVLHKKYNITIRLRILKWRFENEMKMFHEAFRQVRGVTPCLDVARAQSARTVDTDCVFACG